MNNSSEQAIIKRGGWKALLRKIGLVLMGLLTAAVLILTFVQAYIMTTTTDENITAYGSSPADAQGLPPSDKRGAFLVLNEPHNAAFAGNLVELLATTEPGVVSSESGAHLLPDEIKSVLVQSAVIGDNADYRVYRIGIPEMDKMKFDRLSNGRVILVSPDDEVWKPGAYLVDVPSEGMFGSRIFYQFYVDDVK